MGSIYFYTIKLIKTVYYVNEIEMNAIIKGKFVPQWSSFNEFLEWYFDINKSLLFLEGAVCKVTFFFLIH